MDGHVNLSRRARGFWNLALGGGLAFALAATLVVDASAQEATASAALLPMAIPPVQESESVPGSDATGQDPIPSDPMEDWDPETAAAPPPAASRSISASAIRSADVVRVGGMPVSVTPARPTAARAPAAVELSTLGRAATTEAGIPGVLFAVESAAPQRLRLGVGYRSFAAMYGGDWSSRLQLIAMPECVLTTPETAGCRQVEHLRSRNDMVARTVSATLDLEPDSGLVYALAAAPSGSTGSYEASELNPSAEWLVSQQTGEFSWTYPMRTPPSVAGPEPELTISYNSGAVDGLVGSTNNQGSWLGLGFSLESGYIERRYISCNEDKRTTEAGEPNNKDLERFDLCWRSDNATIVFGGQTDELVRVGPNSDQWRMQADDGSRIERVGAGTDQSWVLTSRDGTKYFFGTAPASSDSIWRVPVFGNHPGEPGHDATFANSWANQPWRWNLDRVEDPSGNVIRYFYGSEQNNYGRNDNNAVSTYDRSGHLTRIEYGMGPGQSEPTAKILFDLAERCLPTSGFDCAPEKLSDANAKHWPDVPFDQLCKSDQSCPDRVTPTFFTRKRLLSVTTQIRKGAGYTGVDRWTFAHRFPKNGDATRTSLWLASIGHSGLIGEDLALPKVTFGGRVLPNRVDGQDDSPPMRKWRVNSLVSESGGQTFVTYAGDNCTAGSHPAPAQNTMRCFPSYWAPWGYPEPDIDWFHKYVVDTVTERDTTGRSTDVFTNYIYRGGGAWHFDDNEIIRPKYRTYSEWRGYQDVEVLKGQGGAKKTLTNYRYMRGMDGDPLPDGGARNVSVPDSQGGSHPDHEQLNGFLLEQTVHDGADGPVIEGTINGPWLSPPTASSGGDVARLRRTDVLAHRVRLVGDGTFRHTRVATTYNDDGLPTRVNDLGGVGADRDDLCTLTSYTANRDKWLLGLPSRVQTVAGSCDAQGETLSHRVFYYDGHTAPDDAPTRGLRTRTEALTPDGSGGAGFVAVSRASYDDRGRISDSWDGEGNHTSTSYGYNAEAGTASHTVTNSLDHVTTTTLDRAWGEPITERDANGREANYAYDPLGRLVKVWPTNRSTDQLPAIKFGYQVRKNQVSTVSTHELNNDGTYRVSYEIFDGLLRLRETQEPSSGRYTGRVVTHTEYDSRGFETAVRGPYFNAGDPQASLFIGLSAQIPSATGKGYDAAGRLTAERFLSFNEMRWQTQTTYLGDAVKIDPPLGGTPTTQVLDARGNVVELRQHRADDPAGSYVASTYDYRPDGLMTSMADPAGNKWTYAYDLRGRLRASHDPDVGDSTFTYDNNDQLVLSNDARARLRHVYDALGRETKLYAGSGDGTLLVERRYDGLEKGYPDSATRYVDGAAYTTAVTRYDNLYRPVASTVEIPEATGREELAGTYATSSVYNIDGTLDREEAYTHDDHPLPGLPEETIYYTWDRNRNPTKTTAASAGVGPTTYSALGQQLQIQMASGADPYVWQTMDYERDTGRLTNLRLDRNGYVDPVMNVTYAYDAAGNVTRAGDRPGADPSVSCYRYDFLRRLTQAWTPEPTASCDADPTVAGLGGFRPFWHTYDYDVTGNRKGEVWHRAASAGGNVVRDYTYPASGPSAVRPHAVTKVVQTEGGQSSVDTYAYSAAGDLRTRDLSTAAAESLTWDAEGHLESVAGGAHGGAEFVYDADGNRLIRDVGGEVTLYLGDSEVTLDKASGEMSALRYYRLGDRVVFVRHGVPGEGYDVEYLSSDPQGTSQVQVDEFTGQATKRRFFPFGASRSGSTPAGWVGDHGFANGPTDATGWTHLGAREYDPLLGRFISVDPLARVGDPQSWNGYAYAGNDPTTWSDPSGLMYSDDSGGGGTYEGSMAALASGDVDSVTTDGSDYSCYSYTCTSSSGEQLTCGVVAGGGCLAAPASVPSDKIGLGDIGNFFSGAWTKGVELNDSFNPGSALQCKLDIGFCPHETLESGLERVGADPDSDAFRGGGIVVDVTATIGLLFFGGEAAAGARIGQRGLRALYERGSQQTESLLGRSDTAVIGKVSDLQQVGSREYTLLSRLPDQGSPAANWKQNSGVLRQVMGGGGPIRDASVNPATGALIEYPGSFLSAERYLLRSRGWTYDPKTTQWMPPR